MRKTLLFLAAILIVTSSFAQQGINYKALITNNGNAVASQSVTIQFTILQNGTSNVYQEEHTITTDANGIAIANIGEGTQISGDFNTIDWRNEQFLKVEIDTGSGYVDFGTTAFKAVPHAKSAEKLLPTDKVIIGETDVYATEKLYVKNANPDSELVDFRVGDLTVGKDVLNLYIDQNSSGSGLSNRSQFIEATRGSSLKFKVDDDGRVYSKTGYYTDDYMVATGDITSYSNIKAWGNLEVDGEVTSDLNMGNNEIHGTASGDADMKAYMYGRFYLPPDPYYNEVLSSYGTDGFSVVYKGVGEYLVEFDNPPASAYYIQLTVLSGNYSTIPTIAILDYPGHWDDGFGIKQYDLNGNPSDAGHTTTGENPGISFIIYMK